MLDQALDELTAIDARQGQIVELRYFGGLSESEVAEVLSISRSTVTREWQIARGWLYRRVTTGQCKTSPDGQSVLGRVKEVLDAALDRPPGERAGSFSTCGDDGALRDEVSPCSRRWSRRGLYRRRSSIAVRRLSADGH